MINFFFNLFEDKVSSPIIIVVVKTLFNKLKQLINNNI